MKTMNRKGRIIFLSQSLFSKANNKFACNAWL